MRTLLGLLVIGGLVAGCSGGSKGASVNGDWHPLITGDWTLAPHSENTSDLHVITLDHDIYVGAIRPIAPVGTHHTVLFEGTSVQNYEMVYASGLGTGEINFPEGVGLKMKAGDMLGLQLHVFNTTDNTLSGTSGIEIKEVPPSAIVHSADVFLPGPTSLDIPPNQITTQSGTCTLSQPQTLFALFPHMHQLGTHIKTTVVSGGTNTVLHDADYNFSEQSFTPITPMAVAAGDQIVTECTWNNTTSTPVSWGQSSTDEMCFSIFYRWPALGDEFCTN